MTAPRVLPPALPVPLRSPISRGVWRDRPAGWFDVAPRPQRGACIAWFASTATAIAAVAVDVWPVALIALGLAVLAASRVPVEAASWRR